MENTKEQLRIKMKNILKNIDSREQKEITATENLINFIDTYKYKKIAIFLNFNNEISTEMLQMFLLSEGLNTYAPKIVNNTLEFGKIDFGDEFKINNFGIQEPLISEPIFNFDAVITPFLAFDKYKYRLGYGKGFYDKYFSKYNGVKIGFGFSEQFIETLPHSINDVKLDFIVTDKFLF
ncbi:MAG: 5-formyltetrahydrofolate cyclo-ligase [Clostridia bacterium]|nr:5-formyltetrahydrofolate cyclo-ligase [Clostridia bacterium]